MKISDYLKDKAFSITILIVSIILINVIFYIFNVNVYMNISINFIIFVNLLCIFSIDYYKRCRYYNELINNLNLLDKKYLILETIHNGSFLDANILNDILYEVNKSFIEEVNIYKNNCDSFIEYIEMFIHEIKIPLSSLTLMNHNYKGKINKKMIKEIKRIDFYLDQILYYVRSNSICNDFIIKDINLSDVINKVLLKNKDDILDNKINIVVDDIKICVLTDSKWLEFIINQIVNNSIKYKKDINDSIIKFSIEENKDKIKLKIYDNGIGINSSDIPRVFDKCFTGINGRKYNSTGIGLYIVKTMCNKLGHIVSIKSIENEFTEVIIEFGKNDLYKIN